ncbi:Panacea domain-containing protein [Curtobacterium citreum]|uniref:Panacea domain-containing protein n=1 Tax=Curtobacterium citreum TaxID=2036 RepID=A0ABT2HDJ5_9MICO|nr:Panacea domain-containing protein [Curtobacterium citreum]MCS6521324.1 Panacea domain-containing protein [Curtobacterium citreum]
MISVTTTAIDVAAYIRTRVRADMWSLQKLTYLSQAWSLGINGRPLFAETIEAWRDGPVVRSLYRKDRHEFVPAYAGTLSREDTALIDAVLTQYKGLSSDQLINLTHQDKPWIDARGGAPAWVATNTAMSTGEIRKLYTARTIAGRDVPAPVTVGVAASDESVRVAADSVISRWRTALDLLATR